jgi:diguanylate cyclase (GGDEF)-like protein
MNEKTIVLISQDVALSSIVERILNKSYRVLSFRGIHSAIDYIYNSIPDLVIMDIYEQDRFTVSLLNNLKADPIFHQLPVLIVLDETQGIPLWDVLFVEDYIKKSDFEKEGLSRVDLCIIRSERISEVNPLTKLPGNISINRQIQARIDGGEVFALAYADLDHFKPFNDYYGFTRGDEVIRISGRLILNIVKNVQSQGSFIGHIGGDDFLFIMNINLVEDAAKEIIDAFDRIIPTLYESGDRERGYIETQDRQNSIRRFPFVALSIGITSNEQESFTHYGEITEVASEMKRQAKHVLGSCYKTDRRRPALQ